MIKKRENRIKRHRRVRAKVSGTASRPRLAVFRSNRHTHLQLIDDGSGKTLAAVSTREVEAGEGKGEKTLEVARMLAEKAKSLGIKSMVFDRGGFAYHGRVQAVAEAVRESGIKV